MLYEGNAGLYQNEESEAIKCGQIVLSGPLALLPPIFHLLSRDNVSRKL